jgi:hypothetical protein
MVDCRPRVSLGRARPDEVVDRPRRRRGVLGSQARLCAATTTASGTPVVDGSFCARRPNAASPGRLRGGPAGTPRRRPSRSPRVGWHRIRCGKPTPFGVEHPDRALPRHRLTDIAWQGLTAKLTSVHVDLRLQLCWVQTAAPGTFQPPPDGLEACAAGRESRCVRLRRRAGHRPRRTPKAAITASAAASRPAMAWRKQAEPAGTLAPHPRSAGRGRRRGLVLP